MGDVTRIIAGDARGVALHVPKSGTRPTSDRVREALFSSLDARGALDDAAVLDLYAGTGALGLEAISRGAVFAAFVEHAPRAASLLRRNASAVTDALPAARRGVRTSVTTASALTHVERDGGVYDLVFADPPYDVPNGELERLLAALEPRLAPHGLIVLERAARSGEPAAPERLELEQTRRYGDTAMVFYARRVDPFATGAVPGLAR